GWGGVRFANGEIDLRYDRGLIHVAHGVLESEDWRLEGDGRIGTAPFQILDLDLQLADFPLEAGLTLLGSEADVEGRASASFSLLGGPEGLEGRGHVSASDVNAFGQVVDRAEGELEFHRNKVRIGTLHGSGPGFEVGASGQIDLDTWSGNGEISGRLDLSELHVLRESEFDAEGELLFEGPISFSPEGPEGRLRVSGPDWSLAGFELDEVVGDVVLANDGVDLQLSTGERFGLTLEGRLDWGGQWPVTAVLYLDGTQVDYEIPGFEEMWGRVSGRVVLELPLVDPGAFTVRGTIETGEFHVGAAVLRTRDGIPFVLADGRLEAGPATIGGTDTELEVTLALDVDSGALEATCAGGIGLNIVSAIWPDLRASGRLDVDLHIGGTADTPDFRGTLGVDAGRIRVLGFPAPLNDLSFTIQLEGTGARLEQLRARLGGGEVTGEGTASFEGLVPESYELFLEVANVRVEFPEGFRGAYEGRLALTGREGRATLGGDLTLLRGAYREEIDFASLLLSGGREYDVTETLDLAVTVVLDIDLHADGNVWVRNSLAEVEAGLDLHIGGEIDRPEITGRIWLYEGGKIFFRRVDYEIESGGVEMIDPTRIDPYVDLRARTRVSDYEVRMHVEGTLDELNYQLSSDPPLSAPDIIALLATGRTLEEFGTSSAATGFTGDVVANYFAGALTGSFEKQMQDLLRLERVWIDPLLVEGIDPTARVTLGKEVADDLFLVYSFDVGGPTGGEQYRLYQVDWKASRKIRVVVGSSTTGGVSGDVRYTTRFMGRKGRKGVDEEKRAEVATA
ncbi:MAG: translocation/assembly module TamB domain-containing protein, partial [Acidobacteriota bacterium]|nr:translocation/assembly module TamB domain-containing protein [Acidobacteriota bacterium]